jgi:hypothetical protein
MMKIAKFLIRIDKFLIRAVGEAECVPRGYGLAYWDFNREVGIFCPMPFNWVVRWWLLFYYFMMKAGFPNRYEKEMQFKWRRGYEGGYRDGLRDGERVGIRKQAERQRLLWAGYLAQPVGEREKWLDAVEKGEVKVI